MSNELAVRSWRLYALGAIVTGCMVVLIAKLFYLQVLQHDYYRGLAAKEHWRRETLPADRGAILDSTGQPLAVSVPYESLYATTTQINDPARAATQLAPIVGEPASALEAKLRTKSAAPTLLKRALPAETADRIRALRLWGVHLEPEPVRAHPLGRTAAQLIGVTGVDGKGLSGLELAYETELAGKPGWVLAERDTGGDEIAFGPRESEPPVHGADLVLTLDPVVQRLAERELDAAVARHQATGGTIVVLDPRTGAILAMASRPTFDFDDPNLFSERQTALFRVPAVQDIYEPGSVFKVVTMAAAIDAKAITPTTTYQNAGTFSFGGGVVRNPVYRPPGPETMTQTLQRSSNTGAAYAAAQLGDERFYQYVASFGFGRPTGVGLPGESAGLVRASGLDGWYPFDLAANSFGQGISVTPLQMASAIAAIANGGTLMKPFVVREIVGPTGRRTVPPVVVRQVVRADTARAVADMLVEVVESVEDGKPRLSKVEGYRLAGKTGTAEIPTPQGYTGTATIASFAGFGPVGFGPGSDPDGNGPPASPRFAILVKIDEPKDSPWGESVAAPVFRKLAQELLVYYRIPPQ